MGRLVINGEEIYELDEQCLREKYQKTTGQETQGRSASERGQQGMLKRQEACRTVRRKR